jgi:hypothetical protein
MGGDIMALVGWWPLDGNTNDYSVNNNTGVNNNVTFVNGKIGQAGSFNGTATSFVNIPASNSFKPQLPISISLWYKPNVLNVEQILFQNDGYNCSGWSSPSSGNNLYHGVIVIVSSSNAISASYGNGGSCASSSRRTAVSANGIINNTNLWYHMTVIIKGPTNFEIYINGVSLPLTYSGTGNSLTYSSSNGRISGASNGGLPSNSSINDVRLYDHVLSQKEINELVKAKILQYNFNKDESIIYDGSGFKRDFNIISNSPTWTTNSKIGTGAYQFNGTSNKITLNPDPIRDDLPKDFTISLWTKGSTKTNEFSYIFHRGSTSSIAASIIFIGTTDTGFFSFGINGQWIPGTTTVTQDSNTWYHLVLRYQGSTVSGFINGVLVKTYTSGFSNGIVGTFTSLGGSTVTQSNRFYNGIIDDLQIYSSAITNADILDMYQTRAKIDNQGNLYANEFVEQLPITLNIPVSGQYHANTFGNVFTVTKPILIDSVEVNPNFTGSLTMVLYDNTTLQLLQTKTVNVTAGSVQRIEVGFRLKPGITYWWGRNDALTTPLIRTNEGVLPLTINEFTFIRGDILGGGNSVTRYYYWFNPIYRIDKTEVKLNGQIITNEFNEVGIDIIAYENKTYKEIFEDGQLYNDNNIASLGTLNDLGDSYELLATVSNSRFGFNGLSLLPSQKLYFNFEIIEQSFNNPRLFLRETVNSGTLTNDIQPGSLSVKNSFIMTNANTTLTMNGVAIQMNGTQPVGSYYIINKNIYAINLTNVFGIGNEPTKAQMDQLYSEYRQLKTDEQALRIFRDKIHIQGSLNEGGQ